MTIPAEELKPMKTYKDRMFRMIFSEKEKLLELYNAVSGKHYKDPELLTINTLENAIYMPLRLLHYISDLYESMVNPIKLYGSSPVQIPPPRFIVFYNGIKEKPEREELCLSRLYRKEMSIEEAVERAITECIAEGILRDFLMKNRAEAKAVSIYEYSEEEHIRMEREDAFEDGRKSGIEQEKINTEREKERADTEKERADTEKERADKALNQVKDMEAEIQKLREKIGKYEGESDD